MTAKKPAAVHVDSLEVTKGSGYPPPFDEPCAERARRRLGDLFELTDFGVNIVELAPGAWSAQRHWHSHEDEFVYVLSGTPSLINDEGETVLSAGMCAGFKAEDSNGHHIVNNSKEPATYLEIGSRKAEDDGHYPDIDLEILKRAKGGVFTRKDGTPYPS